jgi:hypothetical protein
LPQALTVSAGSKRAETLSNKIGLSVSTCAHMPITWPHARLLMAWLAEKQRDPSP